MTDAAALDEFAKKVVAEHGPVDVLINNAGYFYEKNEKILDGSLNFDEQLKQIDICGLGPLRVTRVEPRPSPSPTSARTRAATGTHPFSYSGPRSSTRARSDRARRLAHPARAERERERERETQSLLRLVCAGRPRARPLYFRV